MNELEVVGLEEVFDVGVNGVVEELHGLDEDEQAKEQAGTDLHFQHVVNETEDLRDETGDLTLSLVKMPIFSQTVAF